MKYTAKLPVSIYHQYLYVVDVLITESAVEIVDFSPTVGIQKDKNWISKAASVETDCT